MTIPASALVNVSPSVLSAGGAALATTGLVLTTNTRVPLGTVLSFPSGAAVTSFFGAATKESTIANGGANLGTGYFGGFTGATQQPGAILFAQYNQTAVAAYLRGGNISSLTLTQLQELSGSLTVVMDGYPHVISSISFSADNSFSAVASAIQSAFTEPTEASFTASIGATFTGSQSGTNLTTTSVTGIISVGDVIAGTGVVTGTTIISQTSGPAGGAGVYVTSVSGTASTASCTATSTVLDVTVVASGNIAVGQTLAGTSVTGSPQITAQLGGTVGGVGTYRISGTGFNIASEAMTAIATTPVVTFDSTSGAFIVTSGTTGVPSTAAFATGTLAAPLLLTSATGAVLSQGGAAATPATFMNALIIVNSNWVSFMTSFDPDNGSGNTQKQAFAAWKNSQNNRFAYICWDTDITPTNTLPATSSLGYILANDNDSGTALIYEPSDLNLAPFVMGAIASINFGQTNGRISFAYKEQPGLVASVTDPTIAANLGGNPQVPNSLGNGYNFYGAYGSANANFIWFQRGFCTGTFAWLDSYINQIWFNYGAQQALLTLQKNSNSIPYTTFGYGAIEAALAPQIQAGLNFGMFGPPPPGALSQSQINSVNATAGKDVSNALYSQGYYLYIGPTIATTRAARTSPPIWFFYVDNGSVQALNLSSVALN